ncbi:DUF4920 domain-containing protein [Botryobacter ruber]|uniref:DUF4920 domain-containing protein n=1 Tax=Botryobacter ruber TaxID=2171629 RepID=UPI000E0CAFFF|nr:DUF4920 domain-containing protein [Botryobacter ruber]
MKKAFWILLTVAALQSCNQPETANETATETAATSDVTGTSYGAAFEAEDVISASELQAKVEEQDSVQAVVQAEIVESCQAKGCWMDVKLDDSTTMKVTFKDYGFFVPVEDLSGRTVVFKGTAKKKMISAEARRHYAQDAGKSEAEINAITTPAEELRFVADGVIIKEE